MIAFMLLADFDWTKWASPDGLVAIATFVGVFLGVLTTILNLIGQKAAAAKVQAAQAETEVLKTDVQTHKDQIAAVSKAFVGVVQGVEQFRNAADPNVSETLKTTIQNVTSALGVENVVQPIVKAVTEGQGSVSDVLKSTPASVQPKA